MTSSASRKARGAEKKLRQKLEREQFILEFAPCARTPYARVRAHVENSACSPLCSFLSVSSIVRSRCLKPHASMGVAAPPSVIVFTEYEAAVSLEDAQAHGWGVVAGLPQPPETR